MYPYGQPPGGQQQGGYNYQPYNPQYQQYQQFPQYQQQQFQGGQPGPQLGLQQPLMAAATGAPQGFAAPLAAAPTGMLGAPTGVAATAAGAQFGAQAQAALAQGNPDARIPNKRLSFVTAEDQQNFSQLFRASLTPGEQALSGEVARQVLLRSNLPNTTLGDIWQLADTTRSGMLLFPEFVLAMYLCSRSLRGEPVPLTLDARIKKEVQDMVDEISFGAVDTASAAQAQQFSALRQQQTGLQPQTTGFVQPTYTGLQSQPTGGFTALQSQPTGGFTTLQSQPTGGFQTQPTGAYGTGFAGGLQSQVTGGFAGLQSQPTGGYTAQPTGAFAGGLQGLQSQATGGGFTGLQNQATGGGFTGLQNQATGGGFTGLQNQATGGGFAGLQNQATGGGFATLQNQPTGGFVQPQSTGFLQSQATGPLQSQITGGGGFAGLQTQTTGVFGGLQSQTTGPAPLQGQVTGGLGLQNQPTGQFTPAPLSAMPTGRPGQWGFTNATTTGLDTFQTQFTPQATGSQAFVMQQKLQEQSQQGLGIAISKDEKRKYDEIFSQWDKTGSGYISGGTAIEVFGKSGLPNTDLEKIWTLCDARNAGKLNRDEFAVAMHLIFRKLHGHEIPSRLPPELIPPSQKGLDESVERMKAQLRQSKLAAPKPSTDSQQQYRQSAAVFRNNDDALGEYRSASRHRSQGSLTSGSQSSPSRKTSISSSISDLVRQVREKRTLLDAADAEDDDESEAQKSIEAQNIRGVSDLKDRIRSVQKQLHGKGLDAGPGSAAQSAERQDLLRKLQNMSDELPQLISRIRGVEDDISNTRLAIMQREFEKEHPETKIAGSGPNGTVTESDRAAARRKAEVKARIAAITGKQGSAGGSAFDELEKQIAVAKQQAQSEAAANEQSLRALERSLAALEHDLHMQLRSDDDPRADRDRRRWEEAIGVEPEVKDLILEIRKPSSSHLSVPTSERRASTASSAYYSAASESPSASQPSSKSASPAPPVPTATKKETAQERVARIRAEAQRRTREKLAQSGVTRNRRGGDDVQSTATPSPQSPSQPQSQPQSPRQKQPVQQQVPPPEIKKSADPAQQLAASRAPASSPRAAKPEPAADSDNEEEEKMRRELDAERKRIDDKEERRRKRIADMQAERERLRQREQAMKAQSKGESDDDDWGDDAPAKPAQTWRPQQSRAAAPEEPKPQAPKVESTVKRPSWMPAPAPEKKEPEHSTAPPATPAPAAASASAPAPVPAPAPAAAAPAAAPTAPAAAPTGDSNPFHRQPVPAAPARPSTADDDWGSDASDGENTDDDAGPRDGATPAQLASLLFGTMGPQRPTSEPEPKPEPKAPVAPEAVAPVVPSAPPATAVPVTAAPVAPESSDRETSSASAVPHPPAFPAPPHGPIDTPLAATPQLHEAPTAPDSGTSQSADPYLQTHDQAQYGQQPAQQYDQQYDQQQYAPQQDNQQQYDQQQYDQQQYDQQQYGQQQYDQQQYDQQQYDQQQYAQQQANPAGHEWTAYAADAPPPPAAPAPPAPEIPAAAPPPPPAAPAPETPPDYSAPPPPPVAAPAIPTQVPSYEEGDDFDFHDAPTAPHAPPPPPPAESVQPPPPPPPPAFGAPPPPGPPPGPPPAFGAPPPPGPPPAFGVPPPAGPPPGAPPPPGPPPPGPPPSGAAEAPAPTANGGALGNALLGEISTGGFKLKKVDKSQQRISDNSLGRVL